MWQPERESDWREAERRAAEALREAHRRSAPQAASVPEAPQSDAPEREPAALPRPEAAPVPPRRFRRPWQDPYDDGDDSVWRVQGDDEPAFFPPAPPPEPEAEAPRAMPPEPRQKEQRFPVDRETLLVAALLYILWTQEADRELLAAMAYILL